MWLAKKKVVLEIKLCLSVGSSDDQNMLTRFHLSYILQLALRRTPVFSELEDIFFSVLSFTTLTNVYLSSSISISQIYCVPWNVVGHPRLGESKRDFNCTAWTVKCDKTSSWGTSFKIYPKLFQFLFFSFCGHNLPSGSFTLQAVIHLESIFPCEKRIEFLDLLVEKFVIPESSHGEVANLVDKEEISSIFLEVIT